MIIFAQQKLTLFSFYQPFQFVRLDANADVDKAYVYYSGNNPLLWACMKGNLKVVEMLLLANAAINKVNNYGRTPLITAISHGHIEVGDFYYSRKQKLIS